MQTIRSSFWLLLAIVALAALSACSTDGGVGGTGISVIEGNVAGSSSSASAGAARAAAAQATDGDILVRLRGTNLETATDVGGNFRLEGEFAGAVTIEFVQTDNSINELAVNVPSGADVMLVNVRLDGSQRLAQADRVDVDFEGIIDGTPSCNGTDGQFTVRDLADAANSFFVVTSADTKFEQDDDPNGNPTCDSLQAMQRVRIRGTDDGGQIDAARVRIIPSRAQRSAPSR